MRTAPWSGSMSRRVMRSNVVLPEPLDPMSARVAPCGTRRSTSVSTGLASKALDMCSRTSIDQASVKQGPKKRPANLAISGPYSTSWQEALLRAPPRRGVGNARHLGVGNRAHDRADFALHVAFDGGLLGAAVLLAPQQLHFVAMLGVFGVEHRQGQVLALVGAVADPGGDADRAAFEGDRIVRQRRVHRGGVVEVLVAVLALVAIHGA